MLEFATYICFLTTLSKHYPFTLVLSTPVGYSFLQALSLLLEAFPWEKQMQTSQQPNTVNADK